MAVGALGMTVGDFCSLEPEEFAGVLKSYREEQESLQRAEWERLRLHAAITIAPHSRRRVTPKSLMTFPWEEAKRVERVETNADPERRKRFLSLVEKLDKTPKTDDNNG